MQSVVCCVGPRCTADCTRVKHVRLQSIEEVRGKWPTERAKICRVFGGWTARYYPDMNLWSLCFHPVKQHSKDKEHSLSCVPCLQRNALAWGKCMSSHKLDWWEGRSRWLHALCFVLNVLCENSFHLLHYRWNLMLHLSCHREQKTITSCVKSSQFWCCFVSFIMTDETYILKRVYGAALCSLHANVYSHTKWFCNKKTTIFC